MAYDRCAKEISHKNNCTSDYPIKSVTDICDSFLFCLKTVELFIILFATDSML